MNAPPPVCRRNPGSDGEFVPALEHPPLEDVAARLRSHTGSEAVHPGAASLLRLVGSLRHSGYSLSDNINLWIIGAVGNWRQMAGARIVGQWPRLPWIPAFAGMTGKTVGAWRLGSAHQEARGVKRRTRYPARPARADAPSMPIFALSVIVGSLKASPAMKIATVKPMPPSSPTPNM